MRTRTSTSVVMTTSPTSTSKKSLRMTRFTSFRQTKRSSCSTKAQLTSTKRSDSSTKSWEKSSTSKSTRAFSRTMTSILQASKALNHLTKAICKVSKPAKRRRRVISSSWIWPSVSLICQNLKELTEFISNPFLNQRSKTSSTQLLRRTKLLIFPLFKTSKWMRTVSDSSRSRQVCNRVREQEERVWGWKHLSIKISNRSLFKFLSCSLED